MLIVSSSANCFASFGPRHTIVRRVYGAASTGPFPVPVSARPRPGDGRRADPGGASPSRPRITGPPPSRPTGGRECRLRCRRRMQTSHREINVCQHGERPPLGGHQNPPARWHEGVAAKVSEYVSRGVRTCQQPQRRARMDCRTESDSLRHPSSAADTSCTAATDDDGEPGMTQQLSRSVAPESHRNPAGMLNRSCMHPCVQGEAPSRVHGIRGDETSGTEPCSRMLSISDAKRNSFIRDSPTFALGIFELRCCCFCSACVRMSQDGRQKDGTGTAGRRRVLGRAVANGVSVTGTL